MAMMMDPERVHKLLRVITDFLHKWHGLQRKTFPYIDGILMLDDIVGFIGETEFLEFGMPYLKELYDSDVKVKFFHNDAECAVSVPYYHEIGINLYNPGVQMTVNQLMDATQNKVTILGNIPPRDVLASGSPAEVDYAVNELLQGLNNKSRFILSCGGGMPPDVSTENIHAFLYAASKV